MREEADHDEADDDFERAHGSTSDSASCIVRQRMLAIRGSAASVERRRCASGGLVPGSLHTSVEHARPALAREQKVALDELRYDVVFIGGRVIDPRDQPRRDAACRGYRPSNAAVSVAPLEGRTTVAARGLCERAILLESFRRRRRHTYCVNQSVLAST
jgi:hypothetical protein